ncbi:Eco57I restriction-modification methylase domain-containing protein [Flavobacterium sp. SUN052]|uniref:Eco57I restriction-modification methylase domain-containing protein n=1 Tax=Flavobacterium sp. SUN052 TaxID=3002441 RepID=UPI002DBF0E5F|nr:DNA methyltransferase [Flavobacterium sp. SUN052]
MFVSILGYTLNPDANYNLITEQKNETNSKKADGAIIFDQNVHAIIELKGTETTDLSKIENQAFGYKNNQKNCSYVIISNFEKLRFYIDNATEHVEFNLFTLSRKEFDLLYTCLSLESMQTDLPKKIKNESVSNEDKITKELYKDYSTFRKELFNDIEQLNPQYDRLLLFKKTQKLLDRFLFIFFAEDRQLLPTNLIFSINLEWQNLRQARIPVSLYDRYKMYFQDLNTGARVSLPAFGKHTNEIVTAQYDIYAYNGGLFQPDEVLDTIAINDDLLFKHTKKLSDYDFESEVDVNILGHIFENSLNEIDEITNAIEGQEIDKTKTKRKKDGVFYTPKYITKYIVDNTIGKLCAEKKLEIALDETKYSTDKKITVVTKKKLIETLDSYRKWLLQLTIVDPACGSGAFLNQALEFLIAEHKYVDELQAKLFGDALVLSDVEGSILENNLFGVDLNEESVEIAKLSLWLRTAQRNRKLNSLNNNIKCGNSLIDDANIAGEKAFNWHNEFSQVFEKGGFDVVIGNPPYVSVKMLKNIDKEFFINNYETSKGQFDLYTLFYEKGFNILKENGILSFITSNTFLSNKDFFEFRKFILLKSNVVEILNLGETVFIDANIDVAILSYRKNDNEQEILICKNRGEFDKKTFGYINQQNFISDNFEMKINIPQGELKLIKKINSKKELLSEILELPRGIEFGSNSEKIFNETIINSEKILFGKNIDRYIIDFDNKYCVFENNISVFKNHYIYANEKILIQRIRNLSLKRRIIAVIDNEKHLCTNTLRIGYLKSKKYSLKYILSILNSNVINFLFLKQFLNKDIYAFQLQQIPVPKISISVQQPFIEKADLMLTLNKSLQEVSLKFGKYFSGQFKIEKLSSKLEKWYTLSFEEFIKEINKAIKLQKGTALTKKDEFDWIDLFEENKAKANKLQNEIAATDKTIDAMVYELYGLSEEEIKIVENS